MRKFNKAVNLVLAGGGVRGIAYVGVLYAAEKYGISFAQIAGVSAGAMLGSLIAAGFSTSELLTEMSQFDYNSMHIDNIDKKVPAVARYIQYQSSQLRGMTSVEEFLNRENNSSLFSFSMKDADFEAYRGNILKNIITYAKEGYIFNGDYLEEWMHRTLLKKGIRTFGDLKYKIPNSDGSWTYKIRMNAVDINRSKSVVLPDDIGFYGIEPDNLEVSKAVRMSTSIPFAFKPVVFKIKKGNYYNSYNLVDGGVYNNFPDFLIKEIGNNITTGFRFVKEEKNRHDFDESFDTLKSLITSIYDLGIPRKSNKKILMGDIYCPEVSTLDFDLTEQKRKYLIACGEKAALPVFKQI